MAGEVTALGTNAHGEPGASRRRGRAPPARGRRGDHRQDATCPSCASGRSPRRRRSAPRATRGTCSARPVAPAAAAPRRSRPGWSARRSAPTAPARSASRPPGAACSASSPSAVACRWRRAPRAWHGLSVNGVLTRRVADTALFHDVASGASDVDVDHAPASDDRRSRSPPRRRPGALRIAFSTRLPPGVHRASSTATASARLMRPSSCCARSGTSCTEQRPRLRARRAAPALVPRYCAGVHDDARATGRTPSAWNGARAAMARLGGLVAAALLERALAGEAEFARRLNGVFERPRRAAHAGHRDAAAARSGSCRDAARCGRSTPSPAWCRTTACGTSPASPRVGARRVSAPTACRAACSSSGAPTTRRRCCRSPRRSRPSAPGRSASAGDRVSERPGAAGERTSTQHRGRRRALLALAVEAARMAGGLLAERVAPGRGARGGEQEHADRPRQRGRPRLAARDPRAAGRAPSARRVRGGGGGRPPSRAAAACAGSSIRSTAPSTSCSASRSGGSASPCATTAGTIAGAVYRRQPRRAVQRHARRPGAAAGVAWRARAGARERSRRLAAAPHRRRRRAWCAGGAGGEDLASAMVATGLAYDADVRARAGAGARAAGRRACATSAASAARRSTWPGRPPGATTPTTSARSSSGTSPPAR